MSVKGTNFQVTLTIKREDTNELVYYKQDGTRFDNENTIKMKVQTPYIFLLTIRPAQKIKVASMKGDQLKRSSEEITVEYSNYCFHWKSTDIPVTKKNRRLSFNLILEIDGVGVLELPLQMKFYEATDTGHSKWGKSLHHVEFECMHKGGNSFVDILKTIYR
ncbi:CB1 cannabinoid receptor-interacting protein 1 [Caerostris darwini]|uniref:CB1 cannabinoid receptor-interacting protein 1 n=1 Tax=Caerostris darwini TaxID=1538125 RepID=A0AAV4W986_9ARAC|nr:CB1 cannabinoid receptor-interacting protein 1 [Caerostris darwini]